MKVLHVEAGRHLYGGARQVLHLLEGLAGEGVHNVLVCARGSRIAAAARGYAEVVALPWRGEPDLPAAARLVRLTRATRPDLLHAHSRRGADWFTAWAASRTGRPALVTRRVDNPESGAAVRWRYAQFARAVAVSGTIARMLERGSGLDPSRIRTIRSAVDTERFRPGGNRAWLAHELDLPAGAPVAAVVAQLIARKSHDVLLDALPGVLAAHPQFTLLVLGQGPLEAALRRRVAARGWAQRVRFCGVRDDLHRVLPALDFLVHPARAEGLGVALLEAQACGVPVVAARAGGVPEAVRDGVTGYLVAPDDPGALAKACLAMLAERKAREAFGAAGRARMRECFALSSMTAAYLRLYREVLDEGACR